MRANRRRAYRARAADRRRLERRRQRVARFYREIAPLVLDDVIARARAARLTHRLVVLDIGAHPLVRFTR